MRLIDIQTIFFFPEIFIGINVQSVPLIPRTMTIGEKSKLVIKNIPVNESIPKIKLTH